MAEKTPSRSKKSKEGGFLGMKSPLMLARKRSQSASPKQQPESPSKQPKPSSSQESETDSSQTMSLNPLSLEASPSHSESVDRRVTRQFSKNLPKCSDESEAADKPTVAVEKQEEEGRLESAEGVASGVHSVQERDPGSVSRQESSSSSKEKKRFGFFSKSGTPKKSAEVAAEAPVTPSKKSKKKVVGNPDESDAASTAAGGSEKSSKSTPTLSKKLISKARETFGGIKNIASDYKESRQFAGEGESSEPLLDLGDQPGKLKIKTHAKDISETNVRTAGVAKDVEEEIVLLQKMIEEGKAIPEGFTEDEFIDEARSRIKRPSMASTTTTTTTVGETDDD